MTSITDAILIRYIAEKIVGCTATIATTGHQLTSDYENAFDEPVDEAETQAREIASYAWLEPVRSAAEYPAELLEARRAAFVAQIEAWNDPRTAEERMRDEWEMEVRETRESDYPY